MTLCDGKRILIDATGASIGGSYTYLVNIMPRICAAEPRAHFRLMLRHEGLVEAITQYAIPNLEVIELPTVGVFERLRYVFVDIPKIVVAWQADLYFSVSEVAPVTTACPMIAAFRNANVFTREVIQPLFRERMRLNLLWLIARIVAIRCEKVMFVSEDSARWIGDSIGLPASRRVPIHHGIDAAMWAAAKPYREHPRPYILSVSSVYIYKNFVRLIQAWAVLAERCPDVPDLIIIGEEADPGYTAEMQRAKLAAERGGERVFLKGWVPYDEVQSYCAGASLMVIPSYLETFGHPLLEAMASSTPLVAADIPVFREIAGDAAIYADPMDADAIADAIESALEPDAARDLVHKGKERIKSFSWDRSTQRLLALFEATMA